MPTWKRIFLRAAGFGAGTVVALAIIVAGVLWYTSRPEKPKPWNRNAITAQFYRVSTTTGTKLQFEYNLENNTEEDYELAEYSTPKIAATMQDTNSLVGFAAQKAIELQLTVFIPAHGKTRVSLTLAGYDVPGAVRPTLSDST